MWIRTVFMQAFVGPRVVRCIIDVFSLVGQDVRLNLTKQEHTVDQMRTCTVIRHQIKDQFIRHHRAPP